MATSFARSPPIPRRSVPPPSTSSTSNNDVEKVNGLAACIAAMNVGANSPNRRSSFVPARPPPVPPRGGTVEKASTEAPPDLSRLLARRPPPPPARRNSFLPNGDGAPPPLSPALPLRSVSSTSLSLRAPPKINSLSKPPSRTAPPPPPPLPPAPAPEVYCIACRNYDEVDAHAASFPRHTVRSLEGLAHSLTDPFEEDVLKARAIFVWLHYNIAYDTHSFFSGNLQASTPETTLSSGLAVCEGYAKLFENLADFIGLQTHVVSGHGKGYGYQALEEGEPTPEFNGNHAWNCVQIDEEWHLIDPCWGSGAVNGPEYTPRLANRWFCASPVEFGMRHFPEDPSFQLTPEEVSWEEYILAPEGPTLTSDFTDLNLHPMLISPPTKYVPEKVFTKFSIAKRCEHLSTAETDNYVYLLSTSGRDFTPLEFSEEEQAWSATIFTPRNGDITVYSVDTLNGEDAFGVGLATYTKAIGRKPMTFKGLAVWTVVHI